MSIEAQKQIRENTMELHDFLKDLTDWEQTVKIKEKKLASGTNKDMNTKGKLPDISQKPTTLPKSSSNKSSSSLGAAAATIDRMSNVFGLDEPVPDAWSEKDLGNKYFKEGKYVQAIDCYSRSIALQPTAVAFANRAMALLKIRRYADAEVDCTEAIELDDHFTKAYSRRGTARKELKKYLASVEDFEFALRLEPENKELRKQYIEAKETYEKEVKAMPVQKKVPLLVQEIKETPNLPQRSSTQELLTSIQEPPTSAPANPLVGLNPADKSSRSPVEQMKSALPASGQSVLHPNSNPLHPNLSGILETPPAPSPVTGPPNASVSVPTVSTSPSVTKSSTKMEGPNKQAKRVDSALAAEVVLSTQAAAARAAANVTAGLGKNLVSPKTSYEFEAVWKGLSGNSSSQAHLLKIMDPLSLPKLFKDSLGAPLLMEIIQSLPLLLQDNAGLVVNILENLSKVGRFSMTVMFLTVKDKAVIRQLWDNVLASPNVSEEEKDRLGALKPKYRLQ
ncbi:unnamed protein product [Sphagnum troendelagicum]|uniref:RNA-polymerase II-associated protein 3-like C-terminal domain-containing protein n=1 Tax=Sphagnum troendelagicum TaxID=128251 RepID=A0ABP0V376_9BRYO